ELHAGHEDDVGQLGQLFDLPAIKQIGLNTFDAPARELFAQSLFTEACDSDHALLRCGTLRETGECWANLSAHSQNDDISWNIFEFCDELLRGSCYHLFEMLDVMKPFRQCGLSHGISSGKDRSQVLKS